MGDRGRMERPNRMARLRLIVYFVLALSAHIDVSNSMMREHSPIGHPGKRRVSHRERVSHQEVHGKAVVLPRKAHSNAAVSQIFENLLRLDRHLNHLEQTGNGLDVKGCPSECYCKLIHTHGLLALVVANCKYDPFDSLAKLFDSHRNLTAVALLNCHLTKLPPEIMKLPLIGVVLDMNEFTEIPPELLELPQLQQLFMNNNKLNRLRADITKFSMLTVLELGHNMIVELPLSIGGMRNLLVLNLTHNELKSSPQSIGALSQLVLLVITHNKLRSLPAEVGNLTKLQGLSLSNNQLNTLPCEMTKLKQLSLVDLSNNPVVKVPPLPIDSLTQFLCENCSIQTLPCTLFIEGHIHGLDFGYNGIKTAACGKIINNYVSQLSLKYNSLQEIPCEYSFPSLISIMVSYNNISTFPKRCVLLSGLHLKAMSFHYNKIDTLHFSSICPAGSTRALKFIGFVHNRIDTIDTSDSALHQCFETSAVIQLGGNMLSTLDSWPMSLSQDKAIELDVGDNSISEFTSSTGSFLSSSQYGSVFRMSGNQIKHFMDIFNGWKVIVNTTEDLNTVLKNAYFDLSYNPLVCDCIDYEVYRYIQALRTEQYNNLVCQKPLSLKGQNPHHIPLIHFVCDVDKHCPNGCICTKVPHSQTINVTCLSYNETDIPEVIPNLPKQNYGYRLDICHQNLHEITMRPYLEKTTEIRLSNNSVTAININSSHVFQRLKILHINNNHLQRLPESVAGLTNESIVEVRLGSNPWLCDCKAMSMKSWIMKNWHIVKDKDIIRCHSPPKMVGVKVINIERSVVCPVENRTPVYVVASISIAVLIFMVYLYINDRLQLTNRWPVGSDECDGELKEFDIFMCACSADEDSEYVENFLIPELERRDFRVLYHREHFHPGKPIHVNMAEALEKSKRTLVFFSNSFRDSGYSMFEFHSAHSLDIQNKTRRLITIKDTNLDMGKLEISEVLYFRTYTYLDRKDVKFWRLLENVLPRKRLGAQVRADGY